MEQETLLPDAGEVVLESVKVEERGLLLMILRASGERSFCPQCRRASIRVRSHDLRRRCDLPWKEMSVLHPRVDAAIENCRRGS